MAHHSLGVLRGLLPLAITVQHPCRANLLDIPLHRDPASTYIFLELSPPTRCYCSVERQQVRCFSLEPRGQMCNFCTLASILLSNETDSAHTSSSYNSPAVGDDVTGNLVVALLCHSAEHNNTLLLKVPHLHTLTHTPAHKHTDGFARASRPATPGR